MHRIEALLRKEIGLDAASIGSSAIERTVRLRMKRLGLARAEDYARLLKSSRAALDELVEAVVVTETWFFRDRDPFKTFAQLALEWLPQHPSGTLRVLSVPCSSGEEPYSLAMALLDAHVATHRFVIDAVDISTHALARAKHGVYGKNSFRGKELLFRERYFRHTKDGYVLNPRVRESVRFHRDNLLGDPFLVGYAPYDFIFCRNLLIYFDRATQLRALDKLDHLLAPQGVLFVGPAELPLVSENGFVTANLPMAFACRKAPSRPEGERARGLTSSAGGASPSPRAWPEPVAKPAAKWTPADADARPSPRTAESTRARAGAVRTAPGAPSDLDAARELADAGHLKEAAAVCEAHLRETGPSAQAYYLLGLVRDASGDPQALEYYRKALYLEPNHYEALLQMSLLLEKTGDLANARIFKRRAQRVQPKT